MAKMNYEERFDKLVEALHARCQAERRMSDFYAERQRVASDDESDKMRCERIMYYHASSVLESILDYAYDLEGVPLKDDPTESKED